MLNTHWSFVLIYNILYLKKKQNSEVINDKAAPWWHDNFEEHLCFSSTVMGS